MECAEGAGGEAAIDAWRGTRGVGEQHEAEYWPTAFRFHDSELVAIAEALNRCGAVASGGATRCDCGPLAVLDAVLAGPDSYVACKRCGQRVTLPAPDPVLRLGQSKLADPPATSRDAKVAAGCGCDLDGDECDRCATPERLAHLDRWQAPKAVAAYHECAACLAEGWHCPDWREPCVRCHAPKAEAVDPYVEARLRRLGVAVDKAMFGDWRPYRVGSIGEATKYALDALKTSRRKAAQLAEDIARLEAAVAECGDPEAIAEHGRKAGR